MGVRFFFTVNPLKPAHFRSAAWMLSESKKTDYKINFSFLQTQFAGWFLSSLTCGNELKTGTERISSKIQSESVKGCLSSIRWRAYSFRSSEGIRRSWWLGCSLDGDCRKARGKTEVCRGNTSVSPSEELKKVAVKREVWASLLLVIFSQLRRTNRRLTAN